jgi:ferredoxin
MNCLNECPQGVIQYGTQAPVPGEIFQPDLSKRAFLVSLISGTAVVPMIRLNGSLANNWNPALVRPPGALVEEDFLSRCVKCGQCMRICPTNVIQPSGIGAGIEELWTPVLNFRIGTSGCQFKCIACADICPTAAIRPITLDERLGIGLFKDQGPIRIGTAFISRGRCLPWAMDKPCIVCQENCPVSPKAISIQEYFAPIGMKKPALVRSANERTLELEGHLLEENRFATGDYYCFTRGTPDAHPRRITGNTAGSISISQKRPWQPPPKPGTGVDIKIRLQRPVIVTERCIGCGVCEHECPVRGKRAITITAENESRNPKHKVTLNI